MGNVIDRASPPRLSWKPIVKKADDVMRRRVVARCPKDPPLVPLPRGSNSSPAPGEEPPMGSSAVAVSPSRRIQDSPQLGTLLGPWSDLVPPKERGCPAKSEDLASFSSWEGI